MASQWHGKIWEYRLLQLDEENGIVDISVLTRQGAEGWELVQVTRDWAWLKREAMKGELRNEKPL